MSSDGQDAAGLPERFWEKRALRELDDREWEALCDGCGLCCVFKVEDDETGEVFLTNVACPLLNPETCRCGDYPHRQEVIPDCAKLTADNIRELSNLLPPTCAYRRLADGKGLPDWHPLITGDPRSTEVSGMSAHDRLVEPDMADDIADYIIHFDDEDDSS